MKETITLQKLFQIVIVFYEEISKDKELIHSDLVPELRRFQFKVLQWSKNRVFTEEIIESIKHFLEEEYLVNGYIQELLLNDNTNELWVTFNENDKTVILKK